LPHLLGLVYLNRDFSHEILFAGEDIQKKNSQKNIWGGKKNPAFPSKLALGKKP
jgi:hypothetical protein